MAGRRGPQPTPTKTLAKRGSWRAKAREKAGEPMPPELWKLPPAPKRLDAEGKKWWKSIGEKLIRNGILTEIDLDAFEWLCHLRSKFLQVVCDPDAEPKDYTGVYTALNKAAAQFGLNPSDRSRLTTVKPEEKPQQTEAEKFFSDSNLKISKGA